MEAKAFAMLEAYHLASNLCMSKVIIELYCKNVIDACRKKKSFWQIRNIMIMIEELKDSLPKISYHWIPQEVNRVAHFAAKSLGEGNLRSSLFLNPKGKLK